MADLAKNKEIVRQFFEKIWNLKFVIFKPFQPDVIHILYFKLDQIKQSKFEISTVFSICFLI